MKLSVLLSAALAALALVPAAPAAEPVKLTLGAGCFWCVEAVYEKIEGVSDVVSGYAGGKEQNPTYEQVGDGRTGHAECVQITFDPDVVSLDKLLDIYWKSHDATDGTGVKPDFGRSFAPRRAESFEALRGREAAGVGEHGLVDLRFGEVRAREIGAGQVGPREVGSIQQCAGQVGPAEIGERHLRTIEVGPREVGAREVSAGEIGAHLPHPLVLDVDAEVGPDHPRTAQIGARQVGDDARLRQIGAGEHGSCGHRAAQHHGPEQRGPDQLCAAEVGAHQPCAVEGRSGQVYVREVGRHQPRSEQIGAGEARVAEVHAAQVDVGQVLAREVEWLCRIGRGQSCSDRIGRQFGGEARCPREARGRHDAESERVVHRVGAGSRRSAPSNCK